MLNVSPSTIRYYDKEKFVAFCRTYKGGIRIFKDKDYEFFKNHSLSKKKTGMPIKKIFVSLFF